MPAKINAAAADDERARWTDDGWPQVSHPGVSPARETSFGDPALWPDLHVESHSDW